MHNSQHLVLTFFFIRYRLWAIGLYQLFLPVLYFPVFLCYAQAFGLGRNFSQLEAEQFHRHTGV